MLDDLKRLHQRDKSDALGIAARQWRQLVHRFEIGQRNFMKDAKSVNNVVLAGMGGSALAAAVFKSWRDLPVPFEIVRGYDIPAYVGDKTLFIASSYSGNTEEALSALQQAESKNAVIVVMASGGRLADIAEAKDYPLLKIPADYQPRHTTFYGLKALADLFDTVGLTEQAAGELEDCADWLKGQLEPWIETIPIAKNPAKQLALEIMGKSPVIYSGPKLSSAAYKWKINFNENAKSVAWGNRLPEFNHNEFIGWSRQPVDKPYAIIELRSNLERPEIQERFIISDKLLSGRRPAPLVVDADGDTLLKQLLWTIALGDFTSIYLALVAGIDPTPVDLIEELKRQLGSKTT